MLDLIDNFMVLVMRRVIFCGLHAARFIAYIQFFALLIIVLAIFGGIGYWLIKFALHNFH